MCVFSLVIYLVLRKFYVLAIGATCTVMKRKYIHSSNLQKTKDEDR